MRAEPIARLVSEHRTQTSGGWVHVGDGGRSNSGTSRSPGSFGASPGKRSSRSTTAWGRGATTRAASTPRTATPSNMTSATAAASTTRETRTGARCVTRSARRFPGSVDDACRFAENAWLVREREAGQAGRAPRDIAREMFRLADGCTMSAKKDGLSNIGGFLCTNDDRLARAEKDLLILTEGFPTYGGLAARDLEATAIGLEEVLEPDYLAYRHAAIRYLVERLDAAGVPVMKPAGGHAIYLDAKAFLAHVPPHRYPGQALAVALYVHGGIRTCEIGTVMFGRPDPAGGPDRPAALELVRLAIPRRAYTQSHMDYVLEAVQEVFAARASLPGYRITDQAPHLRHFTAKFAPVA